MWVWLLPLIIVVLILAWYIFTSGQPRTPAERVRELGLRVPFSENVATHF